VSASVSQPYHVHRWPSLCVILPTSASAKEHRSALVKHEFQLTHPCPSTGRTNGACPGYVKDHIVPLASEVLTHPRTCSGSPSRRRKRRISGKRRAVLARREIIAAKTERQPLTVPCRNKELIWDWTDTSRQFHPWSPHRLTQLQEIRRSDLKFPMRRRGPLSRQ